MPDLLYRPRARRDLEDIWTYTRKTWSRSQADEYVRSIDTAARLLLDNPELGVSADHVRAGYRKLRVQSHLIFYRIVDKDIDIVRILHIAMDVERHLP